MIVQEYASQLNSRDCRRLIEAATPNLEKAGLLGEQRDEYRIADGTWVPREHIASQKMMHIVANITKLRTQQMELVHIVKYDVGGEYKEHHDFFHLTEAYAAEHMAQGGNRIKTALFYLNDDYSGGETRFPKLDITVQPERGKLLIWENVTAEGKPEYLSLHAGLPVISGTKYIAVIFIREHDFELEGR